MTLYVLFYEKAIETLREKGFLSFITSNKWMAQKYGIGLRRLLLANKISAIIDFSRLQVFDSATVDTQITLVNKARAKAPYRFNAYSHVGGSLPQLNSIIFTRLDTSIFSITEEHNFKIGLTQNKVSLIGKIQESSLRLDDVCYVSKGAEIHKVDGTSKDIFLHTEFNSALEPYAEGKHISRWHVEADTYLNYSPLEHKAPVFREFFEANKIINKRTPGRNRLSFTLDKTGYFTNETVNNAILYKDLSLVDRRQVKTWLTYERVETSKLYTLEFLTGLLNSSLLYWFYDELLANGLHFYPSYMRQLPICTINPSNPTDKAMHDRMVALVERMLSLHEQNKGLQPLVQGQNVGARPAAELAQEIAATDKQIDALVYELYGLTDEEIRIVEGEARG